jgi:hypothetical protein
MATTEEKTKNEEVVEEPKKKKDETVTVKKADFDRIMATLDKQAKDISLLYKAADKNRISSEINKEGVNLIKQVRVWTWADTGKNIIGWKMNTNRCEVVMGKWVEEQNVSTVLEDGEVITTSYLEFVRNTLKKISADLLSRTEEYDEQNNKITMFKVQFPNGKQLVINSTFVN